MLSLGLLLVLLLCCCCGGRASRGYIFVATGWYDRYSQVDVFFCVMHSVALQSTSVNFKNFQDLA